MFFVLLSDVKHPDAERLIISTKYSIVQLLTKLPLKHFKGLKIESYYYFSWFVQIDRSAIQNAL